MLAFRVFFGRYALVALAGFNMASPSWGLRVAKADFPRFAGVVGCRDTGTLCEGSEQGFILNGLSGEGEFQDPSSSTLAKGDKVVLGFLEGKPFAWNRYSVDFPSAKSKWIVLNELTVGEGNRAFLTQWKEVKDSLEFIKVEPHYFSLSLGELFVQTKVILPDGSLLLVLKGEGSDAGINVQDYRSVRLPVAAGNAIEVDQHFNRSDIPVQKILERLNADEVVDEVQDSILTCEVSRGPKAPSGGPWMKFIKAHSRVLYTKAGPQETPIGRDTVKIDIWKIIRTSPKPNRAKTP
jgi:hypothetical protein